LWEAAVEAEEYTRLAEQEVRLWWFWQLHSNIFALLDYFKVSPVETTLIDLGSGTGGLIGKLRSRYPAWTLWGIDKSPAAVAYAREMYGNRFLVGSVNTLPFRNDCVDIVISADVLCHRSVNPEKMLGEIRRILKPGGLVVLHNPAYNWLFSYHDRFVHTARRYTKRRMTTELRQAGYGFVHITYWNTMLFPLMVLKRKLFGRHATKSDVQGLPRALNALFTRLAVPEAAALRRGIVLPFGGSVLAVARKV
jgi:SAM-dependent methyltransferase